MKKRSLFEKIELTSQLGERKFSRFLKEQGYITESQLKYLLSIYKFPKWIQGVVVFWMTRGSDWDYQYLVNDTRFDYKSDIPKEKQNDYVKIFIPKERK